MFLQLGQNVVRLCMNGIIMEKRFVTYFTTVAIAFPGSYVFQFCTVDGLFQALKVKWTIFLFYFLEWDAFHSEHYGDICSSWWDIVKLNHTCFVMGPCTCSRGHSQSFTEETLIHQSLVIFPPNVTCSDGTLLQQDSRFEPTANLKDSTFE